MPDNKSVKVSRPIYRPDLKASFTRNELTNKWDACGRGTKLWVWWVDYNEWREATVEIKWKVKNCQELWIHIAFQATGDEDCDLSLPETYNRIVIKSTTTT